MLGYGGRTGRVAYWWSMLPLVFVPYARVYLGRALAPWVERRFQGADLDVALLVWAVVDLLIVCAWIWAVTVLVTRRVRDIGWPGWIVPVFCFFLVVGAFSFAHWVGTLFALLSLPPRHEDRKPKRRGMGQLA
jgi:uncharacterized membrane protein YhaH (DUF805 family)